MSEDLFVDWTVTDKRQDKDKLGGSGTHLVLVVEREVSGQHVRKEKTVSGATWDAAKVGDVLKLYP